MLHRRTWLLNQQIQAKNNIVRNLKQWQQLHRWRLLLQRQQPQPQQLRLRHHISFLSLKNYFDMKAKKIVELHIFFQAEWKLIIISFKMVHFTSSTRVQSQMKLCNDPWGLRSRWLSHNFEFGPEDLGSNPWLGEVFSEKKFNYSALWCWWLSGW